MDKLGVPTAVINTKPFVVSSQAMAASHGIPDYPYVIIPHPISTSQTETLHQWADQAIDEIVSILINGECETKAV
jgi:hypothetical protein